MPKPYQNQTQTPPKIHQKISPTRLKNLTGYAILPSLIAKPTALKSGYRLKNFTG
jgi:hypothetical protein